MTSKHLDEEAVFHLARRISDAALRSDYLNQACAGDQNTRDRVEALLQVHEQEQEFLKSDDQVASTVDPPSITECVGQQIGPYKLLQQIGEGGFGVVYMAEQKTPVKRRVALKIIKPGMDTQQVIARFEAERQALAMMDHPNIARALDVGTTDTGRPYFVMELVKGMPITQYCDEHHLTPRERLEMFVPVCQAVQHAHQKGIIHRDIKPSNILIAEYDNQAVPKIIDFGVAKALNQQLTEKTMFTQYGQIIGTLEYMSPEQAKVNQLDVDTRSDIYSLGVLLYELLTGTTPIDKERLRTAALDELMRIIREEEPPRPSVRLSSMDTLPSVATSRKTEPRKLSLLLRGELDWIVMKAMDKERSRRYETANDLREDVLRYLSDEAVHACPPSTGYRLAKFSKRNRPAILTAAVVCLSLVAGVMVAFWQAAKATAVAQQLDEKVSELESKEEQLRHERDEQERLVDQYRQELFYNVLGKAMAGDESAEEAIEHAVATGVGDAQIAMLRGQLALYRGRVTDSIEYLRRAVEIADDSVMARGMLSVAHFFNGNQDRSIGDKELLAHFNEDVPAEQLLFVGQAMIFADCKAALKQIQRAIRARNTPIARAVYALALSYRAEDIGDKQLATQAVAQIRAARTFLENHSFVNAIGVFCHLAAYKLGVVEVSEEVLRSVLLESSVHKRDGLGHMFRAWAFAELHDMDAAEHEWDQVIEAGPGDWTMWYAAFMKLRGKTNEARQVLEQIKANGHLTGASETALLRIYAEDPRLHGKAQQLLVNILDGKASPSVKGQALASLLLLGESREVTSKARTIDPSAGPWWINYMIRYHARLVDEEELLQQSHGSRDRSNVAEYLFGMRALGEGRRELAQQHFQRCIDHDCFHSLAYWESKAYLKQLEEDADWLNWSRGQGSE